MMELHLMKDLSALPPSGVSVDNIDLSYTGYNRHPVTPGNNIHLYSGVFRAAEPLYITMI